MDATTYDWNNIYFSSPYEHESTSEPKSYTITVSSDTTFESPGQIEFYISDGTNWIPHKPESSYGDLVQIYEEKRGMTSKDMENLIKMMDMERKAKERAARRYRKITRQTEFEFITERGL